MKYLLLCLLPLLWVMSCEEPPERVRIDEEEWFARRTELKAADSLLRGKTYLPVYSQIYSSTQRKRYNMTETVSLRNLSQTDTIYISQANYYNTEGGPIRTYFDYPIYLNPLETIFIVTAQMDIRAGTAAHFIFEWYTPRDCPEPLFEAVMNSMQGTQGIAFTTRGVRID
jgi:hypothetical protein